MKLHEAKKALAGRGLSLRKRDGEFRVNFRGGQEATAYYTNDLQDAVDTGMLMTDKTTSSQTA